jgi:NAD-dependent deacetylase
MLIVGGTSLSVYPAAGLVRYYPGKRLVLINKSVTPYDRYANLRLQCGLGEVFSQVDQ